MNIAIVNLSTDPQITAAVLSKIAAAIEAQLFEHYAPFCQSAGVHVYVAAKLADVPPNDAPLALFDHADQAGLLGWHAVTPDGRAYGKVFWDPIKENSGTLMTGPDSLSVTVSHEALEAAGNPYVNGWSDMPDGVTEDAQEECDRVEADAYEMSGTGVWVSNFLGPRAFRPGPGPYDWMNLCKSPFEIRPGGYAIRRTGGPKGTTNAVWGAQYPEWKKKLKEHPAGKLSRRRAGAASAERAQGT